MPASVFANEAGPLRRMDARRLQTPCLSATISNTSWKTSVTTLVPAMANRPSIWDIVLEEGLRTDNVLLTNQTCIHGRGGQPRAGTARNLYSVHHPALPAPGR